MIIYYDLRQMKTESKIKTGNFKSTTFSKNHTTSQSAIYLINNVSMAPGVPCCASLIYGLLYAWLPLNIIRALQDVDEEACADMPGYMAVERPDSWIIRGKLHYQVSTGRQESCVSSNWILGVDNSSIPLPEAIRKDLVVMPMQMHWMCECQIVEIWIRRVDFLVFPDDTHNTAVTSAINIPLWVRGVVENPLVSQIQDRFIVVDSEGLVIKQVYWVASFVFRIVDMDSEGQVCRWGRNTRYRACRVERCVGTRHISIN